MLKKVLFFTLAIAIAIVSVIGADAAVRGYTLGDADNNNEVEIIDATIIQRILSDMITDPDGSITHRADVDRSGDLDIIDVTWIQRYNAGMDVPYRIGEYISPVPATDPYELPIV